MDDEDAARVISEYADEWFFDYFCSVIADNQLDPCSSRVHEYLREYKKDERANIMMADFILSHNRFEEHRDLGDVVLGGTSSSDQHEVRDKLISKFGEDAGNLIFILYGGWNGSATNNSLRFLDDSILRPEELKEKRRIQEYCRVPDIKPAKQ